MATKKMRRNDEVVILTGKDKGKRGKLKLVFSNKNRAIISGINLVKKHQKPIPDKNVPGGIIKKEAAVNLSNVAIFNPVSGKPDRVIFEIKNGKKIRIFKSDRNIVK